MLDQEKYLKLREQTDSHFGMLLLREFAMSELAGKGSDDVSYWLGKEMARQIPLSSVEDVTAFFKDAGFGDLQVVSEKRETYSFQLSGPTVAARLSINPKASFLLEAGFISQEIELIRQRITESTIDINTGKNVVVISVKTDLKDVVDGIEDIQPISIDD